MKFFLKTRQQWQGSKILAVKLFLFLTR